MSVESIIKPTIRLYKFDGELAVEICGAELASPDYAQFRSVIESVGARYGHRHLCQTLSCLKLAVTGSQVELRFMAQMLTDRWQYAGLYPAQFDLEDGTKQKAISEMTDAEVIDEVMSLGCRAQFSIVYIDKNGGNLTRCYGKDCEAQGARRILRKLRGE